jgi:hypothetical protein
MPSRESIVFVSAEAASGPNDPSSPDVVTGASAKVAEEIALSSARQRVLLAIDAVVTAVAQVLGRTSPPLKEDRLMDIGLDSLMAIELRNRLQIIFGVDQLSSTLIFDYPTSEGIARLLLVQLGYQADGSDAGSSAPGVAPAEKSTDKMKVHSDEELDDMSSNEIAELLRAQLGQ